MAQARKKVNGGTGQKPIEQYEHKDKKRLNNPQVGLVDEGTEPYKSPAKTYQYDPHIDPQLQWAGKAEHTSFEVPTVSLHVHERIDPRRIIESVKKEDKTDAWQPSLFETEKKPLREAIEFYKHKNNWSNRLIAGDSLLVMNSLLEKEGMSGKVQMVYFDPPYGIKYGSNFQPFVNKRDVKDVNDGDLTAEPEMIKAFRDTWELGIHSYLTYLRDRLLLSKELLQESGSVFVQISDENVHHVRELMDEVFGRENFISQITFRKKLMPLGAKTLECMADFFLWYSKDKTQLKYRQLYRAAVPAPVAKSFEDIEASTNIEADISISRSGETLRQDEWRNELLRSGVRAKGGKTIVFTRVEPLSGTRFLQAEAETKEDSTKQVVVCFGPEHAPLEQRMVELALEEARTLKPKPEIVLFCAFHFDPEARKDIEETNWPGITLLEAQMNADMLTDDLKKKRSSNESFWLIGQPDVSLTPALSKGEGEKKQYVIEVHGFDYYNPKTGTVDSGGKGDIAMWMLDHDYDGRSLFPSQVFFPMAGAKEGWATLARNLKADIDEEKIEAFGGTVSLPFTPGREIAVKIIDARGIESLKIIRL